MENVTKRSFTFTEEDMRRISMIQTNLRAVYGSASCIDAIRHALISLTGVIPQPKPKKEKVS